MTIVFDFRGDGGEWIWLVHVINLLDELKMSIDYLKISEFRMHGRWLNDGEYGQSMRLGNFGIITSKFENCTFRDVFTFKWELDRPTFHDCPICEFDRGIVAVRFNASVEVVGVSHDVCVILEDLKMSISFTISFSDWQVARTIFHSSRLPIDFPTIHKQGGSF